jgi:hypothetical protein
MRHVSGLMIRVGPDPDAPLWEGDPSVLVRELCEQAHDSYERGNFDLTSLIARTLTTELAPSYFMGWYIAGISAARLKEWPFAISALRRCLELAPPGTAQAAKKWRSELLYNLGSAYQAETDTKHARRYLERAIALIPRPEAWTNLGNVFLQEGLPKRALACYAQARQLHPTSPNAQLNASLAKLLTGDLVGGFRDYEARWRMPEHLAEYGRTELSTPRWDGSPLNGRRLFLHAEQGFGDTMQMLRYVPLLDPDGGQIIVELRPPTLRLVSLLDPAAPALTLIARDDVIPEHDVQAPMMSLPFLFGTDQDTIPFPTGYLRAPEQGPTLPPAKGCRVGLVWAGSPGHAGDRQRSVPFALLEDLLATPGVEWVTMQMGERALDAPAEMLRLSDLAPRDFTDTACVLRQLDLLVTVDTAMAHLAGALGVPCWVILPPSPDWRWMLGRSDSPWYASLKLYRRPRHDAWQETIARVRADLVALLARRASPPERAL